MNPPPTDAQASRDAVRGLAGELRYARAVAILDIILRDEIGHVEVGNRWYQQLCAARALDPIATYSQLAKHYNAPAQRGPFNLAARKAAGFTDAELAALQHAATV